MDAQQVFNSMFDELINEDYSLSIDTDRYQSVLDNTLSKMGFTIGTGNNMLRNNSNLNIGKTAGYKNKIIENKKKDWNRNINKVLVYHQKSTQSGSPPTQSKTRATLEVHSIRCSDKSINVTAEKNNGENGVDCLQFFVKQRWKEY